MSNEFKEMMEEVYKFLRDKIVTRLGDNLTEGQKEKLFSFDTDNGIIINSSNKIIEYDRESDTINISDGFLNTEYLQKIKLKYSDFNIETLKSKINEGSPYIILEELVNFSEELKIQEKDIIKSLYIQEILKMILLYNIKEMKEEIVIEGFIELISHEIGVTNGFIVSSCYKKQDELGIAILLKEEWGKKFEDNILSDKLDQFLDKIENKKIIKLIDDITDERRIIESTQNLDEVVDSINEVVEEISQVTIVEVDGKQMIKYVDENEESSIFETADNEKFMELYHELKKRKGENQKITREELMASLRKFEDGVPLIKIYDPEKEKIELTFSDEENKYKKMKVNTSDESFVKEAIVKIDENTEPVIKEELSDTTTIKLLKERIKEIVNNKEMPIKEEEYIDIKEKFDNSSDSLTIEELEKMNDYINDQEKLTNKKVVIKSKGKVKIILSIITVLIVVALGILIGWLLFNIK